MERWAELLKGTLLSQRWERYNQLLRYYSLNQIHIPAAAIVSDGFHEYDSLSKNPFFTVYYGDSEFWTEPCAMFPSPDLIARVALAVQADPRTRIYNFEETDQLVVRKISPGGKTYSSQVIKR